MKEFVQSLLFDQEDHELVRMVNEVLSLDRPGKSFKKLLGPYLHPHGIKEMAAPKELRIAYAMIHLLDALNVGKAEDRVKALRSVMDEVLHTSESCLRKNTARVLLQIMKELVRAHGSYQRQLELAHDFRTAVPGKPRTIRRQLYHYHLLEMPETWNQITLDDHVHDANTKGRKSATHLVMDAWIKGIRFLTVIYYNYVTPQAAAEIVEAAEIMGITVRIGLELSARFRDRYVQCIWSPRGFSDAEDFLEFLERPEVRTFLEEGRKVSAYQQQYVFAVLEEFNARHRLHINAAYNIELAPISQKEFSVFVEPGQPSLLHLSDLIYTQVKALLENQLSEIQDQHDDASAFAQLIKQMEELTAEKILNEYLVPSKNPTIPDPDLPDEDQDVSRKRHDSDKTAQHVPEMLRLSPLQLYERLSQLHSGYRITLNLCGLTVEDVLELLYDSKGMITHLEIFNYKDYSAGDSEDNVKINELQFAINNGNVMKLKRLIREIIQRVEDSDRDDKVERCEKLAVILYNITTLRNYYKKTPLKSRIGTDSTGRFAYLYGMGFVLKETLPHRARKECEAEAVLGPCRQFIPVSTTAFLRTTYIPCSSSNRFVDALYAHIRLLPGLQWLGYQKLVDWDVQIFSTRIEQPGNLVTLGGVRSDSESVFSSRTPAGRQNTPTFSLKYLNHGIKHSLKMFIGFLPAFVTFVLTKDWWVLRYLGAVIWFGITGLRNILQSVLGGGGLRRSPLLRWKDYVSWGRLSDSLLYTGFSVPLLDYAVKRLLLDALFGITTTTNPILLYTVMALANGMYISTHNIVRGLPRTAIVGNFFRSILSIPIAIAFNAVIGNSLTMLGVEGINRILQKWAAVISKAASDCVAGVIEGVADRHQNMRMRFIDYEEKLEQLRDTYAQLELLFPENDVAELLESPKVLIKKVTATARQLEKIIIINSLDLLYFWMYQPRARNVLRNSMRSMSLEEIHMLVHSQYVLKRQKEISKLFINGLIGKNFSRALAFFLNRSEEYITAINRLAQECILRKEKDRMDGI
ncbi:hypothetical protein CSB45_05275 [candidate division KSB3 bacterium]|uniref:Uncharacterized protein n=1 Tax=candidate division KSB3 bacterium TaxID=2044937 RepID=A0A2G6E8J1_9BACT|nr:MAG: hypothetical protein CSB45_05275 [candidate division KSB3 bacterium]PIE30461.1 MAG: hypothetical protein CSA57_04040 [candidate division KSB3 bacterium]